MDLVPIVNSSDTYCLYFGTKFNFYINVCVCCLSGEASTVPYVIFFFAQQV